MRTTVFSAIVLAVLVLPSCRTSRLNMPIATKAVATGQNGPFTVIGTMQNRDRVVTVKTGPAGIVYSIASKDGQSLYENIPAEKLKAEAPALHDFIESGTAGYAGLVRVKMPINGIFMDKPFIDATR